MNAHTAPYGSWKSPITSELIVAESIPLGGVQLDGDDVYWLEGRPREGGRYVVVRLAGGRREALTPAPFNVRTRVHEYGGGAFCVHDGGVIFANYADQRLYRQRPGEAPEAVTPPGPYRYADGVMLGDGRFLCVREDHGQPGQEAVNSLVVLRLDGEDAGEVVVSGGDFYAAPRVSPDGRRVCWLTWRHPNMPWDGCELWVADWRAADDGVAVANAVRVAGGAAESILQPTWGPDGALYYASDASNWWNLYRWEAGRARALHPMAAEFGRPQWQFGQTSFGFSDARTLVCGYRENGRWFLAALDVTTRRFTSLQIPYETINHVAVGRGVAVLNVDAAARPRAIVRVDLDTLAVTTLRTSSELAIDPGYISRPRALTYPTDDGQAAHALFYPPTNAAYAAPEGERPPLLVISHGGPTSAAEVQLDFEIQYWTSRGIGVLDVNYSGSSGYGRAYRTRLNGRWGLVDVADCINGARYLVEQGLADGQRLAIRGGSAGGYTTLCALTFHDFFQAGASYFGVSDVEALARETHKFESRYLDSLIGPYPEARAEYVARSPIHFADQLNCPLILFQGLEDQVVPPNQSEAMYRALLAKGIPVAYVAYEGEQHGFRRAENIRHSLDAELYFYGRIFGFALAEPVAGVAIENLAGG
ncbi:MAG: S9 family peptidase [Anaerolineales bacterium]|nr:S9 family peptidase [Anaerolineales bacterium]